MIIDLKQGKTTGDVAGSECLWFIRTPLKSGNLRFGGPEHTPLVITASTPLFRFPNLTSRFPVY